VTTGLDSIFTPGWKHNMYLLNSSTKKRELDRMASAKNILQIDNSLKYKLKDVKLTS